MIRVTIEVMPGGDEARKKRLALIEIWNVGGPPHRSLYLWKARDHETGEEWGPCSEAIAHNRFFGAMELVRKVITELLVTQPSNR